MTKIPSLTKISATRVMTKIPAHYLKYHLNENTSSYYLDVPVVGCSEDDWCTSDSDDVDDDDDIGDDSSDDGSGVHGRTTISGKDNIFRL